MAAVSGHSFSIGPMGKLFKSLLLWNQSANLKQTWHGWSLGSILSKIVSGDHNLHPRWLPWTDIVLTYIVEPYGIWIVKLRCIRHADIHKWAYLCQVSDTGSPEPLVFDTWLWHSDLYHVSPFQAYRTFTTCLQCDLEFFMFAVMKTFVTDISASTGN